MRYARRRRAHIAANTTALIGIVIVVFSATPLPVWLYLLTAAAVIAWLVAENRSAQRRDGVRVAAAIVLVFAACHEARYHFRPAIPARGASGGGGDTLYVIGDSISAAFAGSKRSAWPQLLAEAHNINVVNLARAGAKSRTILPTVEKIGTGRCVVLIEIGGNDVLGNTPPDAFETDLDRLLSAVVRDDRLIVMLELPLFPFQNRYGSIQRRLARQHGVVLVPKRFFARVLATPQATTDGVHLTQSGHERMAEVVGSVLLPVIAGTD
jgi:acyl-CoA thioesterase-1